MARRLFIAEIRAPREARASFIVVRESAGYAAGISHKCLRSLQVSVRLLCRAKAGQSGCFSISKNGL